MIDNYLDFVKAERKHLLKESKARFFYSKLYRGEWMSGWSRGWACAQLHASWRWRKLQKDIEATLLIVNREWDTEACDPILSKFDF